ncbi:MAG TPA: ATP-binding protein [Candidatus Limnocylindrales bacterium]|nr:ATP-binding protein [Candidatus Limnocylindrales bacterium]
MIPGAPARVHRAPDGSANQLAGWWTQRVSAFDTLFLVSTVLLAASFLPGFFLPGNGVIHNRDLDNALAGMIAGVAGMAALLQWLRYREERSLPAFLLSCALLALALANVARAAVTSADLERILGYSMENGSQAPAYAWLVSRSVAGVLFLAAGVARVRSWSDLRAGVRVVAILAAVAAGLASVVFAIAQPVLPDLVQLPNGMGALPEASPVFVVLNAGIASIFAAAAVLQRAAFRRTHAQRDALLTIALLVAAFGQLQAGFDVTLYVGLIGAGDLLRAGFYLVQMLAFRADLRGSLQELQHHRDQLLLLREAEIARAIVEERSRLAREVHDGLTQDLWLAQLRLGELATLVASESAAQDAVVGVRDALEEAVRDARLAIVALDVAASPAPSFVDSLRDYIERAADRLSFRVEVAIVGTVADVGPRTSAEIVRIVQEALANARKHAQASVVKLSVTAADGELTITVDDDGIGIAWPLPRAGRGMASMQERARSIGATIQVGGRLDGPGTRVMLTLPQAA